MFVLLRKNIILIAIVALFLYAAFIAGYIFRAHFAIEHPSISVERTLEQQYGYTTAKDGETQGQEGSGAIEMGKASFVASVNGTKYHLSWCSGAQRIKEQNKITFSSRKEAEDAGYTPAANCPEIELFESGVKK